MLFVTHGFDQGDPPSPLFFALGFRPHLQQLEETLRRIASEQGIDPNRVRVLACTDDVTVLVPARLASAATTAAAAAFRNFGLQLRADKTQAWSHQAPYLLGFEEQWRAAGLTLVGVPMGDPLPPAGLPGRQRQPSSRCLSQEFRGRALPRDG